MLISRKMKGHFFNHYIISFNRSHTRANSLVWFSIIHNWCWQMKPGRLIWKELSITGSHKNQCQCSMQLHNAKWRLLGFFKLDTLDSEPDEHISFVDILWYKLGEKRVQRQKIGGFNIVMVTTTSGKIIWINYLIYYNIYIQAYTLV